MSPTFPSAQSTISWIGRCARYIDVVFHHIGKPKKIITAQKAAITLNRVWMASEVSGGGARCVLGFGASGAAAACGDFTSPFSALIVGACFASSTNRGTEGMLIGGQSRSEAEGGEGTRWLAASRLHCDCFSSN